MTTPTAPPQGTATTLPSPSSNGSAPPRLSGSQPPVRPAAPTRSRSMGTSLIAGVVGLAVVLIFIIQNAHAVNIGFLGAYLHLSLALALLLAVIAGAMAMAAAGTARITQLRRIMRLDRRIP